jgi:Putative Flp pilus-assembly TadE/G-like
MLIKFARDRRANVLVTFALAITSLLGAAGLGSEAASWYASKRDMQNAADLGAASGVLDLSNSYSSATATTDTFAKNEARASAGQHGYSDSVNSAIVSVNVPAATGTYSDTTKYAHKVIEVIVQKPVPRLFSGLFLPSGPTIGARAVAMVITGGDCLLVTNSSIPEALQLTGNPTINLDCNAAINSTATGNPAKSRAFYVQGSASFTAPKIIIAGGSAGIGATGGATVNGTVTQGTTTVPYTYTVPSTIPSCGVCTDITTTTTINAGGAGNSYTIKGNINPSTGQTITLSNGVFYIDGGSITLAANTTLNTNNATIVLTNSANLGSCTSNCSGIGTFSMQSSTANLNLNAVSDTTYATHGIALYQDPRAPVATLDSNGNCASNCNTIYGGPTDKITGAVYMNSGNLTYQGTPATGPGCTQLIVNSLILGGNPSIYVNGCDNTGVVQVGPNLVAMVE